MTTFYSTCFVAGAGAWGTALAVLLADAGRKVTLWTRNEEVADTVIRTRKNSIYLPDVTLPSAIEVTTDKSRIVEADAMLCVIPTQHIRAQLPDFREALTNRQMPVALCSKGIEQASGKTVHQMVEEIWPEAGIAVLSGPSFAADVAARLPTAVTLADQNQARGEVWTRTLATPAFRPYWSSDVIGAELGGAIKNVLAIACGMSEGAALGQSAKAALMARGFAETLRFATAMGARAETLNGLSGLGDIILTCSSTQSRNYSLGVEIGKGRKASDIIAERKTVAEGAATAPVLTRLASGLGVDMPICSAVETVLNENVPVLDVVQRLLERPLRSE